MSEAELPQALAKMTELTPRQIVAELDKFIIGQSQAKRAVAVAIRNRLRRQKLPPELRDEVLPKNILMIGPTGVGKTEIARRLAKLVGAPFLKVEATKFTEVGYVGRDVESMIRELLQTAIRMVRAERFGAVAAQAEALAEERLLHELVPEPGQSPPNPWEALMGAFTSGGEGVKATAEEVAAREEKRRILREKLASGQYEEEYVEIEVEDNQPQMLEVFTGAGIEEMGINMADLFGGLFPRKRRKRRVKISEARRILAQEESQKLIDMDSVIAEAIQRTEQAGIIFLDEIDKIAGRESGHGPDVSREGVQRDILPIVEGSTVMTKHGPVRTDHILFIAAGAFHVSKPSDLIPELQGRFPIRVELESLTKADFIRILTQPQNALLKQYQALLATEGITIEFTEDAIEEIAALAMQVNESTENIGARRLHTLLERLLEDIAFQAPDPSLGQVTFSAAMVREKLGELVSSDLSRYIL